MQPIVSTYTAACMPPRLIVNSDDFGLTRGINRAIAELHMAGVVTSASLMARGPAFDDAVRLAQAHHTLGVGCHVVLIDGVPVRSPEHIPSLLGSDREHLRPQLKSFVAALLLGRINVGEVEEEIVAQIQVLQGAGIHVTHVDTHKHTHIFPLVAQALLRAAERTGVRCVRTPFEPSWSLRQGQSSFVRRQIVSGTNLFHRRFMNLPQIRNRTVLTTAGTLGISATGSLNQLFLEAILDHLPEGTWELVCHPGYNDTDLDKVITRLRAEREIERGALCEVLSPKALHPQRFELIHYGRLRPQDSSWK